MSCRLAWSWIYRPIYSRCLHGTQNRSILPNMKSLYIVLVDFICSSCQLSGYFDDQSVMWMFQSPLLLLQLLYDFDWIYPFISFLTSWYWTIINNCNSFNTYLTWHKHSCHYQTLFMSFGCFDFKKPAFILKLKIF